jgi:hypothetical protein
MRRTAQRMASPLAILFGAIFFGLFVQVVLDIAVLGLRRAGRFVERAFDLLRRAADGFPSDFLNLARCFLDPTLDLIFVDAHAISPAFRRQTADTSVARMM